MNRKKILSLIITLSAALQCSTLSFAAECKTTSRYYLENDKITLSTLFSGYEEGSQVSYMISENDGGQLYYNQFTAETDTLTEKYTVSDRNIDSAVMGINDGDEFIAAPIGVSQGNVVSFELAEGTYAVCTAENGRIKTFDGGNFKIADGERVDVKLESDGESDIVEAAVNDVISEKRVFSLLGAGKDIKITTKSVSKERNILKVSDDVKPESLFNIYGEGFNIGETVVHMERAETAGDLPGKDSFNADIVNTDEEKGNFITVKMPENCKGGQYKLWVENNNRYGYGYIVNAARPQWMQQIKTAQGQTNKIIGRCLMPRAFGSDNNVSVKLENSSGTYYPVIVNNDSYSIEFLADENIPIGKYTVSVSNGDGIWSELEYNEYGTMLEITETSYDPLGLDVWWAGEFNYDNVVTVNGNTGKDIQNAIVNAYKSGGGVVYLPEGTYNVTNLSLYDGVILKGAGADKTILDTDGNSWIIIRGGNLTGVSDKGLQGVYGLTIRMRKEVADTANIYPDTIIHFQEKANASMSRVFIKNCNIEFPIEQQNENAERIGREIPFFVSCSADAVIDGCNTVSRYGGMHITTKQRTRITNNSCTGITGSVYSIGECSSFENNTVTGAGLPIEKGQHEGIIARGPCYIDGNSIDNIGIDGCNDGETILAESAGGYTKMAGNIVNAGSNYAVVDGEIRNWDMTDQKWGSWQILIVDGKGLGQIIPIESMDEQTNTIKLFNGWDIVPDTTSKFIVTTAIKSMTITNNYTGNGKKGIWLYNGCCDSVVANNTTYNCQGIYVRGFADKRKDEADEGTELTYTNFWPSYFNTVVGNRVSGVSRLTGESSIGSVAVVGGGKDPVFGVLTYGTEIRNNILDAENRTNISGGAENAKVDGIYLGHYVHGQQIISEERAYKAAIAEGNTVKNAHTGISAGGDVFENKAQNTLSLRSDTSRGITLYKNSFLNVNENYSFNTYDGKAFGNADIKTVMLVNEEIGTNPMPIIAVEDKSTVLDDTINISLAVKNICADNNISLIAAEYNDLGELCKVSVQNKVIEPENTDKFELSFDLSDSTVTKGKLKVFVWNKEKMYPLSEAFEILKYEE